MVIGTGAGGLCASAHLAKAGFEVVALERSDHVGGLLSPFEREGYLFDPGVHYLGRCAPGEAFDEVLQSLGLSAAELMAPMDDDAYDTYRFPDLEVRACRGREAYRDRLAAQFPGDVRGVDNVFEVLAELATIDRVLRNLRHPSELAMADVLDAIKSLRLVRYLKATFGEILDHEVSDPRLKAVFAAPCGDYGLPPSRASGLMGLGVIAHYLEGAYFPRGGSGELRDAIRAVAEGNGATFRTGAEVAHLGLVNGRVRSVELTSGERVEADAVVAAIDPRHVFGGLLGEEALPRKLRERIRGTTSSLSTVTLYLGVNRDLREVGLCAGNVWDYPTIDIDALYEPIFHGKVPERWPLFISPNSLKDPTGRMAPEGKTALEVSVPAPVGLFGAWANVPHDERGEDFHALKARLEREVVAALDERLPGVVEHVELRELATPLALEHWVNAIDGGLYGPAQTPDQSMMFRFPTSTFVPNLFLAGAGVLGGGVLPSLQSGQLAARQVERQLSDG